MVFERGLKDDIAEKAIDLGFGVVRVTGADPLATWEVEVERRHREGMIGANERHLRDLGADPRQVMPGAASVVILARPYAPFAWPLPEGMAGYSAYYRAYPQGRAAARQLASECERLGVRAIAGPRLPNKALAARAGLGSFGRNSLVHCQQFGSFISIHSVLIDAALEPDEPAAEICDCGGCAACVSACPTGAIMPGGAIDLRRCVRAYMDSGEVVPLELREAYGTSILGCEACQRVCPRNAKALQEAVPLAAEDPEVFSLAGLFCDDEGQRRERLERMAVAIGTNYARERRVLTDAAIAVGNSGDPGLAVAVARGLGHLQAPVRAHSAWAIGRLRSRAAKPALEKALGAEPDPEVAREIRWALEQMG
ncbi:MAG: epoxyqueuosine reductase [Bacillota bacterium]